MYIDATPAHVEARQAAQAPVAARAAHAEYRRDMQQSCATPDHAEGGVRFPDRFSPLKLSESTLRVVLATRAGLDAKDKELKLHPLVPVRMRDADFLFVRSEREEDASTRRDWLITLARK